MLCSQTYWCIVLFHVLHIIFGIRKSNPENWRNHANSPGKGFLGERADDLFSPDRRENRLRQKQFSSPRHSLLASEIFVIYLFLFLFLPNSRRRNCAKRAYINNKTIRRAQLAGGLLIAHHTHVRKLYHASRRDFETISSYPHAHTWLLYNFSVFLLRFPAVDYHRRAHYFFFYIWA